jgi:hypothetical protein
LPTPPPYYYFKSYKKNPAIKEEAAAVAVEKEDVCDSMERPVPLVRAWERF